MWSAGVQREIPLELHRRRHLRRPPRRVPAARAQHQPAAGRHAPGESGRQHRRASAVQGLRRHPPVGERRLLEVQQPADQRRPPLQERLQVRRRLHARPLRGQRQQQARRSVQHATTTPATGATRASTAATCSPSTTSTICRSTSEQAGVIGKILGGWQISGSTFMRTGTPLWVTEGADIAGIGDTFAQPWNLRRRSEGQRQRAVLGWQRPRRELLVQPDGVLASGRRHVRQRAAEQHLQPGPVSVGHRAVQERRMPVEPGTSSSGRRSSTS